MATEIAVKRIVSAARGDYVQFGIESHGGERFSIMLSANELRAILSALIRAGLDCQGSILQEPIARAAFLAALSALDGSDTPPSGQVN